MIYKDRKKSRFRADDTSTVSYSLSHWTNIISSTFVKQGKTGLGNKPVIFYNSKARLTLASLESYLQKFTTARNQS